MNILYLCDEYPPGRHGGIGTAVQLLAREMVQQGHKVIVAGFYEWGYGQKDEFEDMGVKVYRFRRGLDTRLLADKESLTVRAAYKVMFLSGIFQKDINRSIKKYRAFLEGLIKEHNIELVEMPDFNDYMLYCTKYTPFPKLSVPIVVKLHGSTTFIRKETGNKLPAQIWKMEHDLLQQATAVVSVSKYAAKKTAEYLDYNKKIPVLYNGINTGISVKGISKIPGRVIFTGTLVESKGIYKLMEAWNIINEKMPEAELYILGKGPIERVKSRLNERAKGSVIFKGHVSKEEVYRQLSEASIAVFPSYVESFGLAALEAILCSDAVINTNRAAGPELMADGVNGYIIDPDDTEQIAERVIHLLQHTDEAQTLGENGYRLAKEKFDIKVTTRETILFYKSIINGTTYESC
ncbi:MAG TPA: glycosyltransferase family 4 protein [Flavipsychrobacter sp.]|nr:glycosyltransferase family 4 protein [Flavipsychrobacter sp.]